MKQVMWVMDRNDEAYVEESKMYNVPVIIRCVFLPFVRINEGLMC